MKRYPNASQLVAKAHRFAVNTLIGVTGVGLAVVSIQIYQFLTAVRPELEKQKIAQQTDQERE